MRHRKAVLKLNRTPSHRKAMFRNMVTSLFKYERIQTTGAKAKELRRWADHLITLAKRGDLHARRQALAIVREKDVVHKLFEHAAERYGSVSGGYTRIVKLGQRPGDAAPVSLVELIYDKDTKKKKARRKKAKADAAPKKEAAAAKPAINEEKKKSAKPRGDKAKSAAKAPSKKKTAGDEKEEKPVKKSGAKKKTAAKDKPAPTDKEDKPKKKAKAAAPKEEAADTKMKKASAKKAEKDAK